MVLLWHHLKNTHWNLCFEECMRLCSNCSFQIFLTNCPQFFLFCFFESDETVLVCSECVVNIWYSISTSVTMLVFSSAKRPSRTTEINWVAVRFASAYVHYSISPWGAWDSIRVRGITVFQTFMYIHCPNPLTHSQFTGFHIVHVIE